MGNLVSFQPSCDQPLNQIFNWLCTRGYIGNLEKNLLNLEKAMAELRAAHDGLKNKVAREERLDRQQLPPVRLWLSRVEDFNTRYNNLLSTRQVELQKLCLCGLCSKNVRSSYSYGKQVASLLEEVNEHILKGVFEEVTEPAPRAIVEERPAWPTVGQEEMLNKAWNRLMKDGVRIMGLHGMGGVGKTTLFKKIHNRFVEGEGSRFEVIWVVVSRGVKTSKLQDDIAEKLHLSCTNKNESDKAAEIYRVLKRKRFVLMLDDIWEKVDLEAIGVPCPSIENGCKIAFTTRRVEVCGQMGDREPMKVNCLEPDAAWELFKSRIAENVLRDPAIVQQAKKVAEKCRCLPLALDVIGKAMSCKDRVEEWENAVDVLNTSAADFDEMGNEIFPVLRFSYDSLEYEHIKSCFLYCALFPEDYVIEKERLIDFWIYEGLIGECQVIKRARNKGYDVLGRLVRANLLMEVGRDEVVMHDVIREMALWIASSGFFVQARLGLREMPEVEDWGVVKRMSLMDNEIGEITCGSACTELTTLLLRHNNLTNLPGDFIRSMEKLVVLDLSYNLNIKTLPKEISNLVSLQYLDLSYVRIKELPEQISELASLLYLSLSHTKIEELPEQISKLASLLYLNLSCTKIEKLPAGFQELKKLMHLDLSDTMELRSISGISKLPSLKILKIWFSGACRDVNLVKELQQLESLQVLTITISTGSALEHIAGNQRLAKCIDTLRIHDFEEEPFNLSLLMRMENLRKLIVADCHVWEINTDPIGRESEKDLSQLHDPTTSPCLNKLCDVSILDCNCDDIKDLSWLLFAPNLVKLHVRCIPALEEVISKEKATNLVGIAEPFKKLESLWLSSLPKLESVYWVPLSFPSLKLVSVDKCPKLRKLPFDVKSVERIDKFALLGNQRAELEWEDEDTKNRFLPSFNRRLRDVIEWFLKIGS